MNDSAKRQRFVEMLVSNKRWIFKIVNSYCRNLEDRKDLEQEITIHLWNSFEKYDSNFKYSTWIYRIALNVAISFYRKQKSRPPLVAMTSDDSLFFIADKEKDDCEWDEKLKFVHNFIGQLDELNKALMLLYLEDKKYEEIAEILGLSKTNVATKISRLKIKIGEEFNKQ